MSFKHLYIVQLFLQTSKLSLHAGFYKIKKSYVNLALTFCKNNVYWNYFKLLQTFNFKHVYRKQLFLQTSKLSSHGDF